MSSKIVTDKVQTERVDIVVRKLDKLAKQGYDITGNQSIVKALEKRLEILDDIISVRSKAYDIATDHVVVADFKKRTGFCDKILTLEKELNDNSDELMRILVNLIKS